MTGAGPHPGSGAAASPTFEEYAAREWPGLFRYAYLLTGNHADAEDVAQQAMIKAHGAWARLRLADAPTAYLRRIATNTYLSSVRPRKRRLEVLTDTGPEPVAGPVEGPEDRMALWPHVVELPPQQRAVVVLRYYEGLSEAEIAETLGCTKGTVKSTAHRALASLRTRLGHQGEEG